MIATVHGYNFTMYISPERLAMRSDLSEKFRENNIAWDVYVEATMWCKRTSKVEYYNTQFVITVNAYSVVKRATSIAEAAKAQLQSCAPAVTVLLF